MMTSLIKSHKSVSAIIPKLSHCQMICVKCSKITSAGDNVVVLFGASAVPPDVVVFPVAVSEFAVLPVEATSSIQDTASSSPWDNKDPPYNDQI